MSGMIDSKLGVYGSTSTGTDGGNNRLNVDYGNEGRNNQSPVQTEVPTITVTGKRPLLSDSNRFYNSSGVLPEYAVYIAQPDRNIYVVSSMDEESFQGPGGTAEYDSPLTGMIDSGGDSKIHSGLAAIGYKLKHRVLTAKVWKGSAFGQDLTINLKFYAESDPFKDVLEPYLNLAALVIPDTQGLTGFYKSPGPYMGIADATINSMLESARSAGVSTANAGANLLRNGPNLPNVPDASDVNSFVSGLYDRVTGTISQLSDAGSKSIEALKSVRDTSAEALSRTANAMGNTNSGSNMAEDLASALNLKNRVSIQLGKFMFFNNVVIKSVTPTWKWLPIGTAYKKSDGYLAGVDITINFEPFFDQTLDDLARIFIPGGGTKVNTWFQNLNSNGAKSATGSQGNSRFGSVFNAKIGIDEAAEKAWNILF